MQVGPCDSFVLGLHVRPWCVCAALDGTSCSARIPRTTTTTTNVPSYLSHEDGSRRRKDEPPGTSGTPGDWESQQARSTILLRGVRRVVLCTCPSLYILSNPGVLGAPDSVPALRSRGREVVFSVFSFLGLVWKQRGWDRA